MDDSAGQMSIPPDSYQGQPEPEPGIDIQHYFNILLKYKWTILSIAAITIGVVALWTFSRTRIYLSTASVVVDKVPPKILGSGVREVVDPAGYSIWQGEEYIKTQQNIACSLQVATTVARKLNLHRNLRFWPPRKDGAHPSYSPDQAASSLLYSTSCVVRKGTSILDLSVEHHDPKLAAQLANMVAQTYVDQNLEHKIASSSGAVDWLSTQAEDLKRQLDQSEEELHAFKRKNDLLAMSLDSRRNLIANRMVKLNDQLTDVRVSRMSLVTKIQQLKLAVDNDPVEATSVPQLNTQVIIDLKGIYFSARRKYLTLRERYLEKHPLVVEQKALMDSAAVDLKAEVRNVIKGLEVRLKQVEQEEHKLAGALKAARQNAHDLNQKEPAFRQLARKVSTTTNLYQMVLSRMKESDLTGQLRINNVRVMEMAKPPWAPIRPKVTLNMLFSILIGLLLGVAMAFLREALDTSVKTEEDVEKVGNLICIGALPQTDEISVSKRRELPSGASYPALTVHYRPMSIMAESCRSIRTNLQYASPDTPISTTVITSPGPEEGKTTTTVGLAIAMAQAHKRVLLVDCDMRKPQLHRLFGIPLADGLTTALSDEDKTPESLIKTTEVQNLFLMTSGPIPPNPAELCQSNRLYQLIKQLEGQFDRIFIDAPPVMMVTDPVVLAAHFDSTLLVVRTGRTTKKALVDTHRQLKEVGARMLGCVLNDMDLDQRYSRYYLYRRRYVPYAYRFGYQMPDSGNEGKPK